MGKIDIRQSVPREWMEMFQLPELKIKNTNVQKVICMIPGACKNNNPDIIEYWKVSYGPGGRKDVKYWKKPGTRGPDDQGPGSKPESVGDSGEPGTGPDDQGPGSKPDSVGDSGEPGTGPGDQGPGSEGKDGDSDEPEPGNNECIARCTAKCDEQGNIKGTMEGEYNENKRRK